MYGVAWLLGWSIYRYDRLLVGGRMDAPSLGAMLTPTGASSAGFNRQSHNTLAPCTTYMLLFEHLYLYKYLFICRCDPTGASSSACWSHQSYNALHAQIKTINNQNRVRDKIKIFSLCHEISAQLRMCSVHCPQDLLLFAKIEVIKKETCKIWPISASAQLLRAAGLTVPFYIMKQPTFKKLAHWKVQPSSLNRAKKEAISKILLSKYCHQVWIKWDQYRREWTSGWTSADTCVW